MSAPTNRRAFQPPPPASNFRVLSDRTGPRPHAKRRRRLADAQEAGGHEGGHPVLHRVEVVGVAQAS